MASETQRTAAMPTAYQPAEVEPQVYQRWLDADVFAPDGAGSRADWSRPPFVIIQPPPNVTGALHLGHAARAATEDLMTRRARMQRRPSLWLPGMTWTQPFSTVASSRAVQTVTNRSRSSPHWVPPSW